MRISDWSSDVCSSDLVLQRRRLGGELHGPGGASGRRTGDPALGRGPAAVLRCLRAGECPARPDQSTRCTSPSSPTPGILRSTAWSAPSRSEEHTSELQSLMRISYAVFCLKKKKK